MPRRIGLAAAGYILLNPPPVIGSNREDVLTAIGAVFENQYLFEGATEPEIIVDEEGNNALLSFFATQIDKEQKELSVASDSSIFFRDNSNAHLRQTSNINAAVRGLELWFESPVDIDNDEIILVGGDGSTADYIGRLDATVNFPSGQNGSGTTRWESFVDFAGDGKPHQLMVLHQVANTLNYIVYVDGIPMANGSDGNGFLNIVKLHFGCNNGRAAGDSFEGYMGSAHLYENGFSLANVRDLFLGSSLSGHFMTLSSPIWVPLDGANVTVPTLWAYNKKRAELADTGAGTIGIRSTQIPPIGKIYFEMEVVSEGESASGTTMGIRQMAENDPVSGEAGITGSGIAYFRINDDIDQDANVRILTNAQIGNAFNGARFQVAIDFDTGNTWFGQDNLYTDQGTDLDSFTYLKYSEDLQNSVPEVKTTTIFGEPEITDIAGNPFDPSGFAARFDGANDYVTYGKDGSDEINANDFTIEWFMYLTQPLNNNNKTIFEYGDAQNLECYLNGLDQLVFNAATINVAPTVITPNEWHHVALVRESGVMYAYIDGVQDATWANATNYTTGGGIITIANWSTPNFHYRGLLSHFRVIERAEYSGPTLTVPTLPMPIAYRSSNPVTGDDPNFTIDNTKSWAAWLTTRGSNGDGIVRLVTRPEELLYLPDGFTAWGDAMSEPVYDIRQAFLDSIEDFLRLDFYWTLDGLPPYVPTGFRAEENPTNFTLNPVADEPLYNQEQLTKSSLQSIAFVDDGTLRQLQHTSVGLTGAYDTLMVTYRSVKSFNNARAEMYLFEDSSNVFRLGRFDGASNFPEYYNRFSGAPFWESLVDTFEDDHIHTLIIATDPGGDVRVWIDGVGVGGDGTTTGFTLTRMWLRGSGLDGFVGQLGEVTIWNEGMTQGEAKQLWNLSRLDRDLLVSEYPPAPPAPTRADCTGNWTADVALKHFIQNASSGSNLGGARLGVIPWDRVYFEFEYIDDGSSTPAAFCGIRTFVDDPSINEDERTPDDSFESFYLLNDDLYNDIAVFDANGLTSSGLVTGDIVGVAIDHPAGKVWFHRNGEWYDNDLIEGPEPVTINYMPLNSNTGAVDGSPTRNSGALFGVGFTRPGKFAPAVVTFDGTNDYISWGSNGDWVLGTSDFTIEMWIQQDVANNDKFILGGRAAIGTLHITTGGATGIAGAMRYVGSSTIDGATDIGTDGLWHHVAFVREGTNVTIYVDGAVDATGTDTTDYTGTGGLWYLGRNDLASSNFFDGGMELFRVTRQAVYTEPFTPTKPYTSGFWPTDNQTPNVNLNRDKLWSPFVHSRTTGNSAIIKFNGTDADLVYELPPGFRRWDDFDDLGGWSRKDVAPPEDTVFIDGLRSIRIQHLQFNGDSAAFSNWNFPQSGKWYCEVEIIDTGGWDFAHNIGFRNRFYDDFTAAINTINWDDDDIYLQDDAVYQNSISQYNDGVTTNGFPLGTVVQFAVDMDQGKLWLGKDNEWIFNGTPTPATGTFEPTVLHMPMAGYDEQTGFFNADRSPNLLVVEGVGGIKLDDGQTQFGQATSMFRDGVDDYLEIQDPANSLNFGQEDWTIEYWLYVPSALTGESATCFGSGATGFGTDSHFFSPFGPTAFYANFRNKLVLGGAADEAYLDATLISSSNFPTGQWVHCAATREGGTARLFINGALEDTQTTAINWNWAADQNVAYFGRVGWGAANDANPYYMADFRATRGVALYTGAFTPPTAALPVIETDVAATSVVMHMPFDGADEETIMEDFGRFRINGQAFGTARLDDAVTNYGTTSLDLNVGSTNTVRVDNPNMNFGTGDFTIEFWYNGINNADARQHILSSGEGTFTGNAVAIQWKGFAEPDVNRQDRLRFSSANGGEIIQAVSTTPAFNWYHIAVTRENGTVRLFIDGVLDATNTNTSVVDFSGGGLVYIGGAPWDAGTAFRGKIEDLRVSNGYARYTTGFTPPAAALPIDPRDYFFNNRVVFSMPLDDALATTTWDDVSFNDLNGVVGKGTPAQDNTRAPNGTLSLRVTDNSNVDILDPNSNLRMEASDDWTVEWWHYCDLLESASSFQEPIVSGGTSYSGEQAAMFMPESGLDENEMVFGTPNQGRVITSGVLTEDTWTHLAVQKKGSSVYFFKDGVQVDSGSFNAVADWSNNGAMRLMSPNWDSNSYMFGNIADVRITKGLARYALNADFRPPNAPYFAPVADAGEPPERDVDATFEGWNTDKPWCIWSRCVQNPNPIVQLNSRSRDLQYEPPAGFLPVYQGIKL